MMVWVLPKMALQDSRWSPFLRKTEEGGDDGAHAGGGGEAGFGAFEGAEAVGEFLHGGVAEAAVDEGVLLVGKDGAHVFGIVIAEAAGQEERGGMFFVGVWLARIRMASVMRCVDMGVIIVLRIDGYCDFPGDLAVGFAEGGGYGTIFVHG